MAGENLTKTQLDAEGLGRIAKERLGSALKASSELKDGCFNASYKLELEDGRKAVLKVAPPPAARVLRYERGIMAAEVEAMRLVAQTTSLPLPGILCHDESRELAPSDFFLMDFIEGIPLNKVREGFGQATRDKLDRGIARYLRELNSLRAESFGLFSPETPRFASWRDSYASLLENLLADGIDAGVELGRPYAELRSMLDPRLSALDPVAIPRFVHWDLWDGNIFVDPAGDSIRGFIDFERALWGDPLMEVNFASWNARPAFLEAYGDGRSRGSKPLPGTPPAGIAEGPGARERRLIYDIYLDLVMVIECSYRAYETGDQERWSRGNLEAHFAELARLP